MLFEAWEVSCFKARLDISAARVSKFKTGGHKPKNNSSMSGDKSAAYGSSKAANISRRKEVVRFDCG